MEGAASGWGVGQGGDRGAAGGWACGVTAQVSPSGTHGRATFVLATHPSGRDTFHL